MAIQTASSIPGITRIGARIIALFRSLGRRLSFWSAIVLPFLYIAMFIGGIRSVGELITFVELFIAHLLALLGGREHLRTSDT